MSVARYVKKLIATEGAWFDHAFAAEEAQDWRALLKSVPARDRAFQNEFVATLVRAVATRPPRTRLELYSRVWANGTTGDADDVRHLPRLAAAFELTSMFTQASHDPRAMEKVQDLFAAAEALLLEFDRLRDQQILERVREVHRALLRRFQFLRQHHPGLIKDHEIGGGDPGRPK